jgi:hypothetical protein
MTSRRITSPLDSPVAAMIRSSLSRAGASFPLMLTVIIPLPPVVAFFLDIVASFHASSPQNLLFLARGESGFAGCAAIEGGRQVAPTASRGSRWSA